MRKKERLGIALYEGFLRHEVFRTEDGDFEVFVFEETDGEIDDEAFDVSFGGFVLGHSRVADERVDLLDMLDFVIRIAPKQLPINPSIRLPSPLHPPALAQTS